MSQQNELTTYDALKDYLTQNIPLPFHPDFHWGRTILAKIEINGYKVPEYNVFLHHNARTEQLYKPYRDIIVSDRVKKLDDNIHDIQLKVLGPKEAPLAILWYASTNFYGTIIDTTIKGLRIRQGNILARVKANLAVGTHPAIIFGEQFNAVQEERKRRSNKVVTEDGSRRSTTRYSSKEKPSAG